MKLRDWINESDYTVAALAPKVGVSERTMYRFFDGSRIPDRTTMKKIKEITAGQVTANDFYDIN